MIPFQENIWIDRQDIQTQFHRTHPTIAREPKYLPLCKNVKDTLNIVIYFGFDERNNKKSHFPFTMTISQLCFEMFSHLPFYKIF